MTVSHRDLFLTVFDSFEEALTELKRYRRAIHVDTMLDEEDRAELLTVNKELTKSLKAARKKFRSLGILEGWVHPLS